MVWSPTLWEELHTIQSSYILHTRLKNSFIFFYFPEKISSHTFFSRENFFPLSLKESLQIIIIFPSRLKLLFHLNPIPIFFLWIWYSVAPPFLLKSCNNFHFLGQEKVEKIPILSRFWVSWLGVLFLEFLLKMAKRGYKLRILFP